MKWFIPTVLTSDEILNKAFRTASKIRPSNTWERRNPRGIYLSKIGVVSSVIQHKLSTYIRKFPSVNLFMVSQGNKSPTGIGNFYYDLFDLTFGVDRMKKALGALNWGVKKTREMESLHIRQLKRTRNKDEMEKIRVAFYGRISSIMERIAKDLQFLGKAREEIRKMPHIDDEAIVVVVAGAPNVGKSSIINMISSGNSRIASYPFTTLGIFLGHLELNRKKVVLVDTPGLLDRVEEERNPIELKAFSALKNLSSAVIFILDPSETCGILIDTQESLLDHLKDELVDVPHLVVENKCDQGRRKTGNLQISCTTEEGKDEIVEWLRRLVVTMDDGENYRGDGEDEGPLELEIEDDNFAESDDF